jgi:hypothetical protein
VAADRPARLPGFLATCWLFRSKIVFSWDFAFAGLATVIAYAVPSDAQISKAAEPLAAAALGVGSALVGVVVAGLAVVVAFLDDQFLALMDEATERYGGVEGQLFPFWFVTATGVGTLLLAVFVLIAQPALPSLALRIAFAALVGLLVWTAAGVFNLVASLQATGVTRAIFVRRRR